MVSSPAASLMQRKSTRCRRPVARRSTAICTQCLCSRKAHLFKPPQCIDLLRSCRRPKRASTIFRFAGRWLRMASVAFAKAVNQGVRRHHIHNVIDGAAPGASAPFDEMMDRGCRRNAAFSWLFTIKPPDKKQFWAALARGFVRAICSNRNRRWQFNQSKLFLEFRWASEPTPARRGKPDVNKSSAGKKPCIAAGRVRPIPSRSCSTHDGRITAPSRQSQVRQLHGATAGYEASAVDHT